MVERGRRREGRAVRERSGVSVAGAERRGGEGINETRRQLNEGKIGEGRKEKGRMTINQIQPEKPTTVDVEGPDRSFIIHLFFREVVDGFPGKRNKSEWALRLVMAHE